MPCQLHSGWTLCQSTKMGVFIANIHLIPNLHVTAKVSSSLPSFNPLLPGLSTPLLIGLTLLYSLYMLFLFLLNFTPSYSLTHHAIRPTTRGGGRRMHRSTNNTESSSSIKYKVCLVFNPVTGVMLLRVECYWMSCFTHILSVFSPSPRLRQSVTSALVTRPILTSHTATSNMPVAVVMAWLASSAPHPHGSGPREGGGRKSWWGFVSSLVVV